VMGMSSEQPAGKEKRSTYYGAFTIG
jgi:hypothetical protein